MNLISIDLEMNKPKNEIIQLGYVIFDVKTGKQKLKSFINIYTPEPIDPFITQLTGLTQEDCSARPQTLQYAYDKMVQNITKWQCTKHPVQWGLDHYELRKQLGLEWKDYIFRPRGIDIKALYQSWAMALPQSKTVAGLAKAMVNLGMEFEGEQHRAHIDAHNTMRVYLALLDKWRKYEAINKIMETKWHKMKNFRYYLN